MHTAWNDGTLERWDDETFPDGFEPIIPTFQFSIIPLVSEANKFGGEFR
jgi:hypothetical protein